MRGLVLRRRLTREGLGGRVKEVEDAAVLGLEAPPLGVREPVLREGEGPQVLEGAPHPLQALLELGGAGRSAWRRPRRARIGERLVPDPPLRAFVASGAERADEARGLLVLEVVLATQAEDALLIGGGEHGQRVAETRAQAAPVDELLSFSAQAVVKGEASLDPPGSAAQDAGDGLEADAPLGHEGGRDARFVHRRDGSGWSVCAEQRSLAIAQRPVALNEHPDLAFSHRAPALEPLEAIDDLVGPFSRRDDSQRKSGEPLGRSRAPPSQAREARPQGPDRDLADVGAEPERDAALGGLVHIEVLGQVRRRRRGGPAGSESTWWKPSTASRWKGSKPTRLRSTRRSSAASICVKSTPNVRARLSRL